MHQLLQEMQSLERPAGMADIAPVHQPWNLEAILFLPKHSTCTNCYRKCRAWNDLLVWLTSPQFTNPGTWRQSSSYPNIQHAPTATGNAELGT